MTHLALALMTYACFVLHVGARSDFAVGGVSPDFLLLALSMAAVGTRDNGAVLWAGLIGFLADCVSTGPLGVGMFCSVVAVYAMRRAMPRHSSYYLPAAVGLSALLTFAVSLSAAAARLLIYSEAFDWPGLLAASTGTAFYTALLFAVLRTTYGGLFRLLLKLLGIDMLVRTAMGGGR